MWTRGISEVNVARRHKTDLLGLAAEDCKRGPDLRACGAGAVWVGRGARHWYLQPGLQVTPGVETIAAPRLSQPGSGRPYPHLRHLCHRAGRHGDMLRWTWPWAPSNSSLSRLPSNSACANRETGFSVHTHTPMSHKTTPQDQIRNTHHVTHTHPCRTKRHPRNTHHVVHTRVLPPSAINCKGRGAVLVQGGHLFLILAFRNQTLFLLDILADAWYVRKLDKTGLLSRIHKERVGGTS